MKDEVTRKDAAALERALSWLECKTWEHRKTALGHHPQLAAGHVWPAAGAETADASAFLLKAMWAMLFVSMCGRGRG